MGGYLLRGPIRPRTASGRPLVNERTLPPATLHPCRSTPAAALQEARKVRKSARADGALLSEMDDPNREDQPAMRLAQRPVLR
jgi:hypothetical protein